MKAILKLSIIGLFILIFFIVNHNWNPHKKLAPGYIVVCDGKGHFTAGSGHYIFSQVFTSRQDAIEIGWKQYEFEHKPEPARDSDNYQWHECKGE